jgi:hypothetical protein
MAGESVSVNVDGYDPDDRTLPCGLSFNKLNE